MSTPTDFGTLTWKILLRSHSLIFQVRVPRSVANEICKPQTHVGFTNIWSNMPSFWVKSSQKVKNGTRTPCTAIWHYKLFEPKWSYDIIWDTSARTISKPALETYLTGKVCLSISLVTYNYQRCFSSIPLRTRKNQLPWNWIGYIIIFNSIILQKFSYQKEL